MGGACSLIHKPVVGGACSLIPRPPTAQPQCSQTIGLHSGWVGYVVSYPDHPPLDHSLHRSVPSTVGGACSLVLRSLVGGSEYETSGQVTNNVGW